MWLAMRPFTPHSDLPEFLKTGEFYYQTSADKWQKFDPKKANRVDNIPGTVPEQLSGANSEIFQRLLRGYFVNYDSNAQTLTLRTPILGSELFRDVKFAIPESQLFYCWPSQLQGTPVKDLHFDLINPPIIALPDEKMLVWSAVYDQISPTDFFIVQLANPVEPNATNPIVKLVWLCD